MSLFDAELASRRRWLRIGDTYEVTKKPRGLDTASLATIAKGDASAPDFTLKAPTQITNETSFRARRHSCGEDYAFF